MGQGLSDHHVALCIARLVGAWITRGMLVVGVRRIRSKKLWEHSTEKDILGLLKGRE